MVEILNRDRFRLAPYPQENFAFDTNQQYYNNIAEIIPGMALYFKHFAGAVLSAEYVRGYYLPFHTHGANPYGSEYNDFRIHLTLSKSIPLVHGAALPEARDFAGRCERRHSGAGAGAGDGASPRES